MHRYRLLVALTSSAVLLASACEGPPETAALANEDPGSAALRIDAGGAVQWKLPAALKEISGLALSFDGRLFAHDDERAVIHELDYERGGIAKSFAFGEPVLGDFEGIAVVDGEFVLSNSAGELFLGPEGGPDERVSFEHFDPGLARECEFEGLGFDRDTRALLLPCKDIRSKSDQAGLKIFAWSIDSKTRRPELDVVVSRKDLKRITGLRRFPASGIAIDPRSGHRFLISARRSLLLELDAGGDALDALELPSGFQHRQTEGVAIGSDGMLFLADEGGRRRARLAIYRLLQ